MINRRKRRDANHQSIRAALEAVGWATVDTSQLGDDVPDLLACKGRRWLFVEVKTRTGKLTTGQQRFKDEWPGDVVTLRSLEDVANL